jgi:prevent-host-death family protein
MGGSIWSIPNANAKLSEVLRRARAGERQVIGEKDPCVVLSPGEYEDLQRKAGEIHLGRWLAEHAPKTDFEPPPRSGGRRNALEA